MPSGDVVAGLDDLTGDLEPEDVGCAVWWRIPALPLQDVGAVDRRGPHGDQHLLACRHGDRAVDDLQLSGIAGLSDYDCTHTRSFLLGLSGL
jgi:hypothetical protein